MSILFRSIIAVVFSLTFNNAYAQRYEGAASNPQVQQAYSAFSGCMTRACGAPGADQQGCGSCDEYRRSALPSSPPPSEQDLAAANMNRPASSMPPGPCMSFIMGGHCMSEAMTMQSALSRNASASAARPAQNSATSATPNSPGAPVSAPSSPAPFSNVRVQQAGGACGPGTRPITPATRSFIESLVRLRTLYGRARCNAVTSFAANDMLQVIEQDKNPRELATHLEAMTSGAWNNVRWASATAVMSEARGARDRIRQDMIALMRQLQATPFLSEVRLRCSAQCNQNPQARCEFSMPLERDRLAWQAVPTF